MSCLHNGHVLLSVSQRSMQALWKLCLKEHKYVRTYTVNPTHQSNELHMFSGLSGQSIRTYIHMLILCTYLFDWLLVHNPLNIEEHTYIRTYTYTAANPPSTFKFYSNSYHSVALTSAVKRESTSRHCSVRGYSLAH